MTDELSVRRLAEELRFGVERLAVRMDRTIDALRSIAKNLERIANPLLLRMDELTPDEALLVARFVAQFGTHGQFRMAVGPHGEVIADDGSDDDEFGGTD